MSRLLSPRALTTVAAVLAGFSYSGPDDEIKRLISARTDRFEQRTGRQFAYQVSDSDNPEYVAGNAKFSIFLRRKPITAIAQIKLGAYVYLQGWEGLVINDYERTPARDLRGEVYRQVGWPMVVPEHDDLTRNADTRRDGRQDDIQVQYSGGWILPQYDGIATITAALASGGSLTDGTRYYYLATVVNDQGEVVRSSETSATADSSHKKIAVAWSDSQGALTYNLYRSVTSGVYGATSLLAAGLTSPSYLDDGTVTLTTGTPAVNSYYNPTGARANLPATIEDGCIREVRHTLRRPYSGLIEERTAGGWGQRWSDKNVLRPTEFDTDTETMLDAESMSGAFFL